MKFFRIAKSEKFQHYKERNPPWFKVYTKINDREPTNDWRHLIDAELGQLIRICAHAYRHDEPMPYDADQIREVLGLDSALNLDRMVQLGVIEVFDSYNECLSRINASKNASKSASKNASVNRSSEDRDQRSEIRGQRSKKSVRGEHTHPGNLEATKKQIAFAESLLGKHGSSVEQWLAGADRPLTNADIDAIVASFSEKPDPTTVEAATVQARNAKFRELKAELETAFKASGTTNAKNFINEQQAGFIRGLTTHLTELIQQQGANS